MQEHLELAAGMASPHRAREWVSTRCGSNPDTIFTAKLLVSELVTNAVTHAHSDALVSLDRGCSAIHVEVEDHGTSELPTLVNTHPSMGPSGRGLAIVSRLSSAWGVRPTARGKAVWFEIPIA